MDVAARLREDARRLDERRLLVITGEPAATRDLAVETMDGVVDGSETRYVGPSETLPWPRIDPERTDALLGATHAAVVLDCQAACRPNAIGRAVGAVDGGGLLVMLTPPLAEWPDRRDGFDDSLAVPPFDRDQVDGHFRRRLVRTLRQHRGVAILEAASGELLKDGVVDGPPRPPRSDPAPPEDPTFPAAAYRACLTGDQVDALESLEGLSTGGAVVLESHRGRGKSSAAGLGAGALAIAGRDVLVTAPRYRNGAEVFARARELLTETGHLTDRDAERDPRRLETERGRVRFEPPAEARSLPDDPDCVIVDEAAALPVRVLEDCLAAPAVAFATTVHGYEGAGRGFSVRFRDRLEASSHPVTESRLAEPIRYAPADPLEVWSFRALALDARPAVDPLMDDAAPGTAAYRSLDPSALLADEHLLREAFGLLVVAHYRTEPDDLARLLDAPNVTARALVHDGHVASVALLAREGGLPAALRERMYAGRRVRGHMIPDVLTSQLRDEDAADPVGYRILRIATHPVARSRGLGSRLLDEIRGEFDTADWLGVGYGATPELLAFWTDNGFSTVHLSTTRNDASGEHSAVMLDARSPAGRALLERHTEWFLARVGPALSDALSGLDPDVVRGTLGGVAATPEVALSRWEWRVAAGIATGRTIADLDPRPVRRLALAHLAGGGSGLTDTEERLLVGKALQTRPWDDLAAALGFPSTAECMRAFGDAVEALVERHGDQRARTELERFA